MKKKLPPFIDKTIAFIVMFITMRITLISILILELGFILKAYKVPHYAILFGLGIGTFINAIIQAIKVHNHAVRMKHQDDGFDPAAIFPPLLIGRIKKEKEMLDRVIGQMRQEDCSLEDMKELIDLRKQYEAVLEKEDIENGAAFTIDMIKLTHLKRIAANIREHKKYSKYFDAVQAEDCKECSDKNDCDDAC